MHSLVGKRSLAFVALTGALLLAGCKDKRVKAVNTGITRDSLLNVIGQGAPGIDSIPNVYRSDRYLIDGKQYEIFYFSGSGKHLFAPVKDTIPWKKLVPIAMIDRVVVGKEWPYIDSLFTAHKIPVHPR